MKKLTSLGNLAKTLLFVSLGFTAQVQANTWNWTNAAGGAWSDAPSWDLNSAPASEVNTGLSFDLGSAYDLDNDLSPGLTLNTLSFGSASGRVNLTGNDLYFAADGLTLPQLANDSTNPIAIGNNLWITNNMICATVGDTTVGGTIQPAGPNPNVLFTKRGAGKFILSSPLPLRTPYFTLYVAGGTLQTRTIQWYDPAIGGGSGCYLGSGAAPGETAQLLLTEAGDAFSRRVYFGSGADTTNIVGGVNTSGTVTYSGYFNSVASTDTKAVYYTAAPGGTVSISILIGGAQLSVVKIGGGTVVVRDRGVNANPTDGLAYAGSTTIRAGTLQLNADANGTGGDGFGGTLGYNDHPVQLGDSQTQPTDTLALLTHGDGRRVTHALSVNPYGASTTIGASDEFASCTFSGNITLWTNVTVSAPDASLSGYAVTLSGNIADGSGANSVIVTGPGTVVLSGTNTYAGSTLVNSGTLALGNSLVSLNSAGLRLASGATLDLTAFGGGYVLGAGQTLSGLGTVTGALTVGSGATLAPGQGFGAGFGALTNSANLTLAGNTVLRLDRSGAPTSDQVLCSGTLAYGGTLTLTNVGAALQAGDSFTLFPAAGSYLGGFSAISPATPGAGLAWDFSQFSSAGIVAVAIQGTAPVISPPLAAQNVECGATATFNVLATGSATLHYQWSVNGTPVPGATGSSFTTNNVHAAGSSYTIAVTVTNNAPPAATSSATLTVVDTTAPVVTVLGPSPVTLVAGASYVDAGATAADGCAGTLPVNTNNPVNTSVVGAYTVRYTATDPSSNVGTATRTVNVLPATAVWTNLVSGTWTDPLNWTNGLVPNNGAFAVDFNAVDLTSDVTVVLAAPETVNTLRFGDVDTASPAGWTITHNGSLANVLTLASPTITVNALGTGAAATIAANIAGSAGLVKLGAGKLQLTGTNTYTGNTTNGQGTLLGSTASIQGNLYLSNAVITVFNQAGGTGTFTGAIQDPASGTRPVLYVTNGSLTLAQAVVGAGGLDAYVDNATLNAQAIAGIGGQTLGLGWYSGPEVNSSFMAAGNFPGRVWFGSQGVNTLGSLNTSGSVTIANYVENRQNGSANPIYLYAAGGGTARVNNTVIQALNPLQQIVKIGPGNVRFGARGPASNNDRAYAGITVIRAGTLLVGANADGTTGALNPLNGGSLGYNNNTVQLGDGETLPSDTPALLLDGNNLLINHPISVNAYGASVTLGNNSGTTVTFNGDITLNTNVTLTAIGGSTVTFSKTLTEAGAGMALTKVGAGTVRLTTANSYSGGTLVSAGTLEVRADGGLGSGNVSVADGATLALSAGTANSYLGSTASLLLNGSAPVVRLNFTGTSTIHALSFDGGVTFAVAGTWGSPSSGAANTDARLVGGVNGEGLLEVLTGSAPLPPNFAAGGVTRLPDGNISLTASGAIGVAYRLWASTNVAATPIANTWTLLSSGTIAVSPFTLEDLEATNYTRRFYLFSAP